VGVRSWLLNLIAPTRRTRRRNLPPRAERRLAAKERYRRDGGPLWSKADRHIRTRLVRVGRATIFADYITVLDEDDDLGPEDDRAAPEPKRKRDR
jgi:hypothetical protein